MKFGNWNITDKGIEWAGKGANRFLIPEDSLTEIGTDNIGNKLYKWILLATDEDWLNQDELYDLNYAFVYAVAQSGHEFDYDLFDRSLAYQYEELDDEEFEEEGEEEDEL